MTCSPVVTATVAPGWLTPSCIQMASTAGCDVLTVEGSPVQLKPMQMVAAALGHCLGLSTNVNHGLQVHAMGHQFSLMKMCLPCVKLPRMAFARLTWRSITALTQPLFHGSSTARPGGTFLDGPERC